MSNLYSATAMQIKSYCAQIGSDPLLVQGAGGNVSWKDGNTLWIKGSGSWLSDALDDEIFIPVDLYNLNKAIKNSNFKFTPEVLYGATKNHQ